MVFYDPACTIICLATYIYFGKLANARISYSATDRLHLGWKIEIESSESDTPMSEPETNSGS